MKLLTIFCLICTLSGCAGFHAIPPNNYSVISAKTSSFVTRIVVDQNGNIYPESPNYIPKKPFFNGFNIGYTLEENIKKDINLIALKASNEIEIKNNKARKLNPQSKTFFLIHGFNNDFSKAKTFYEEVEERIDSLTGVKNHYVEFYWDGLYNGKTTLDIPYFYWGDSLTYSNYAGQIGLRRILNRLKSTNELYFITHSRGAAVAFSSLLDPVYKPEIARDMPKHKIIPEEAMTNRFNKIRIISLAPAIGPVGHNLNNSLKRNLPRDTKIFIGFNSKDMTLKKGVFWNKSHKIGDTTLGSKDEVYEQVEKSLNTSDTKMIQRINYSQFGHGAEKYLDNQGNFECLLWAAGVKIKGQPCITRYE